MTTSTKTDKQSKKSSSVRYTRAIQWGRIKGVLSPPSTTLGQVAHYHQLGLRERVLSLLVKVVLVLSLIWRQVRGAQNAVDMEAEPAGCYTLSCRPDHYRGRSPQSTSCGHLDGDGLSQSVLFHSGVLVGPSYGCDCLLGHQW